jgi:hypothetical protein
MGGLEVDLILGAFGADEGFELGDLVSVPFFYHRGS